MKTLSKRLKDSLDRQHVLSGRQIACLRRDELLYWIHAGDSPSEKLVSELGLTQVQANDILGLPLGYFKRLVALEIECELKEINLKISTLQRASAVPGSQCIAGKTTVPEDSFKHDFYKNDVKWY